MSDTRVSESFKREIQRAIDEKTIDHKASTIARAALRETEGE